MILQMLFTVVCGTSITSSVQIEGMLSFDLKLPASEQLEHLQVLPMLDNVDKSEMVAAVPMPIMSSGSVLVVTAGPVLECIYQYPEKKHVEAILSNIMNILTKVFVRGHDLFSNEDGRRAELNEDIRHQDSRFRVVDRKSTQFFEYIYHNMTHQYNDYFNKTTDRVDRSAADPCQHQQELKQTWRELLDHSLSTFRRAALLTLKEQLHKREQDNDRLRTRLGQYLAREVDKLRSSQLHLLCDHFQLCFDDLLTL